MKRYLLIAVVFLLFFFPPPASASEDGLAITGQAVNGVFFVVPGISISTSFVLKNIGSSLLYVNTSVEVPPERASSSLFSFQTPSIFEIEPESTMEVKMNFTNLSNDVSTFQLTAIGTSDRIENMSQSVVGVSTTVTLVPGKGYNLTLVVRDQFLYPYIGAGITIARDGNTYSQKTTNDKGFTNFIVVNGTYIIRIFQGVYKLRELVLTVNEDRTVYITIDREQVMHSRVPELNILEFLIGFACGYLYWRRKKTCKDLEKPILWSTQYQSIVEQRGGE